MTTRFLPQPAFLLLSMAIKRRLKRTEGYLGGAMLAAGKQRYWTISVWQDEASMLAFRKAEPHSKGMRKAKKWNREMLVARWDQDGDALPSWDAAAERLQVEAPGNQRFGTIPIDPARG